MEWRYLLVALAFTAGIAQVLAHVPDLAGDNLNIEDAKVIENPERSWAIYGSMEAGEIRYFTLDFSPDDRVEIEVLVSTDPSDESFNPVLILTGPGLPEEGEIPQDLEIPAGHGFLRLDGERPSGAKYEGFSPSSYYRVVDLSTRAPGSGTYHAAVYAPAAGGKYSLVVGYTEGFSLFEWVMIPISLIDIYMWGGQGLIQVLAPLTLTTLLGLFLYIRSRGRDPPPSPRDILVVTPGFMFVGSGLTIFYQMAFNLTRVPLTGEVSITVLFGALPILIGLGVIRSAYDISVTDAADRARAIILAVLALFLWAGLIIGPTLLVISAMLPARIRDLGSSR